MSVLPSPFLDGFPGITVSLRRSLSGFAAQKRALPYHSPSANHTMLCINPQIFCLRTCGRLIPTHGSCTWTGVRPACDLSGRRCCPGRNASILTRGLCHPAQTRCLRGKTLFGTRCRDRCGGCRGRRPCGMPGRGGASLYRALCEDTWSFGTVSFYKTTRSARRWGNICARELAYTSSLSPRTGGRR